MFHLSSVMHNGSVVEQILQSLSFEVEAVPQDNLIEVTTTSKATPLNVKIRVRKKDEAGIQCGALSLSKPNRHHHNLPERIVLVSSDQTIISFDVIMEADIQKPIRKPRTNILGLLKPTICLGAQTDEDEYAYVPRSIYKANIDDENKSKPDETVRKFTLSKTIRLNDKSKTSLLPRRNKSIFGKCKPGGCLDPPFGEDKHPYIFATKNKQISHSEYNDINNIHDTKVKTSSIFCRKLFKRNIKDNPQQEFHKKYIKTESVLNLFQAGSLQTNSYSNSIITYPPTLHSSEIRLKDDKTHFNKTNDDTISNESSSDGSKGAYFNKPKKRLISYEKNKEAKINDGEDSAIDEDYTNSYTTNLNSQYSTDTVNIYETQGKRDISFPNQNTIEIPIANMLVAVIKTEKNNELKNIDAFLTTDMEVERNSQHYNEVKSSHTSTSSLHSEDKSSQKLLSDIEIESTDKINNIDINKKYNEDNNDKKKYFEAGWKENVFIMMDSEPSNPNDGVESILQPKIHPNTSNMIANLDSIEEDNFDYQSGLDMEPLAKKNVFNFNRTPTEEKISLTSKEQNYSNKDIGNEAFSYEKSNPFFDKISTRNEIIADDVIKLENITNHNKNIDSEIEKQPENQKNKKVSEINTETYVYLDANNISHERSQVALEISDGHSKLIYESDTLKTNVTKYDVFLISDLKSENTSLLSGTTKDSWRTIPGDEQNIVITKEIEVFSLSSNLDGIKSNEKNDMALFEQRSDDKSISNSGSDVLESNAPDYEHLKPKNNNMLCINTEERLTLSGKSVDGMNIIPFKKQSVEIREEIGYTQSRSISDHNKIVEKSVTIDAKREMSVYDIVITKPNNDTAETKSVSKDDIKINSTLFESSVPQKISITRDIPLEIPDNEGNDLLHIWKNYKQPIVSHRIFNTDHDITKQFDTKQHMNTVKDENIKNVCDVPFMGSIDINVSEQIDKTVEDTDNQSIYKKDAVIHNITNKFKDDMNFENILTESSIVNSDNSQFNFNVSSSVSAEGIDRTKIDALQKIIDYAKNQSINIRGTQNQIKDSDINSVIKELSKNFTIEFENKESALNLKHAMDFKDMKHESAQALSSLLDETEELKIDLLKNFNEIRVLSHHNLSNIEDTCEGKENDHLKSNDSVISNLSNIAKQVQQHQIKQQVELNSEPSDNMKQNNSDAQKNLKSITFNTIVSVTDSGCNSIDDPMLLNKMENFGSLDFKLPKKMPKGTELALLDNSFSDDHRSSGARISEMKTKSIHAGTEIHFALQSYLGGNNKMIIKSLNADIEAGCYPNDSCILIKRNVALDDEIKIPITDKHDLCIQVKNNKQDVNGGLSRESETGYNYETDPTKRHQVIADDIRRTLVAVHEEELVPLRNTILELRENIKSLTSRQIILKNHTIKKLKHTTTTTPQRKCGCMRK